MEQPIEHSLTNEFRNKAEKVLDTRDKLIARIEALPEQKQQTANPHGGFSPLELLSHFALVELGELDEGVIESHQIRSARSGKRRSAAPSPTVFCRCRCSPGWPMR